MGRGVLDVANCRWETFVDGARGVIVVTIYLADSSKLDTALNMYYRAVPLPLIFVSYAMNHVFGI